MLVDLTSSTNKLSIESRFVLAYDAAHSYLQMALRMKGYRTTTEKGHRAILFDIVPQLLPGAAGAQETLAHAHVLRNKLEYQGHVELTQGQIDDMVAQVKSVAEEVEYAFKQFKAASDKAKADEKASASAGPAPASGAPKKKR